MRRIATLGRPGWFVDAPSSVPAMAAHSESDGLLSELESSTVAWLAASGGLELLEQARALAGGGLLQQPFLLQVRGRPRCCSRPRRRCWAPTSQGLTLPLHLAGGRAGAGQHNARARAGLLRQRRRAGCKLPGVCPTLPAAALLGGSHIVAPTLPQRASVRWCTHCWWQTASCTPRSGCGCDPTGWQRMRATALRPWPCCATSRPAR